MPDPEPKGTALLSRRHMLIGGAMLCASGVAFARRPQVANPVVDADLFEEWVPGRFGAWSVRSESGVLLPPPDALSDRLYDNLVTRVYAAPGEPMVMLLLAYNNAQNGVLQVHRPETCYPVGGFVLSETENVDLPLGGSPIPSNFFTAVGPDRTEQVAYFTRLGDDFPRSWFEQRVAVMEANLQGEIPDGIMMRVSVIGTNPERAKTVLSQFANGFYEASPQPLRRLLVG